MHGIEAVTLITPERIIWGRGCYCWLQKCMRMRMLLLVKEIHGKEAVTVLTEIHGNEAATVR